MCCLMSGLASCILSVWRYLLSTHLATASSMGCQRPTLPPSSPYLRLHPAFSSVWPAQHVWKLVTAAVIASCLRSPFILLRSAGASLCDTI